MNFKNRLLLILVFLILFSMLPEPAAAYVGPGAGFALITSFFTLFVAFLLAILSVLSLPVRKLYKLILGKNGYKKSLVKRVIIVGLDGLDPDLAERFMKEGKLPNFSKLKTAGTFKRLKTTFPSISPVAWSTFQTGVNPGRHNIFDFLTRDKKTYLPVLSSAYIGGTKRTLKLGNYIIPIGKPDIRLLRKSQPFWKILGKQGIFSTVLRVPITFPPERFDGLLLSGMCVPDLRGTQDMFTFYTTAQPENDKHTGGVKINVKKENNEIHSSLIGPGNPIKKNGGELKLPFVIKFNQNRIFLEINKKKIELFEKKYSEWIEVTFKAGLGVKVSGICRFLVVGTSLEFELYVTPININPEKAALPISSPKNYATYLAKLQGSYATLGLAEDTWALNERFLDEDHFLKQCYDIHEEREKMFFSALDKTDRGLLVCVFDTTDRIQHTFLRFLDPEHPAIQGMNGAYNHVIEELYVKMDALIGRVMEKIDDKTYLIVMSDHGFKQFKRGVNLNTWLLENGYLNLKDGHDGSSDWFSDVDWSSTKAYAHGLAGIYLNIKGRESQGIVNPGAETNALKKELIEKLSGFKDEEKNTIAINEVFDTHKVLEGPYVSNALDLIVGYNEGYRASWNSVTGKINEKIISDNTKSWGSDHCLDPRIVPGVFFCNQKLEMEDPAIVDIAPTVLSLFGIDSPKYMEGKNLANRKLSKIEDEYVEDK